MNDGGPAYPCTRTEYAIRAEDQERIQMDVTHPGMSLRDWFAGQALAGWMATYTDPYSAHPADKDGIAGSIASASYRMADAMLAVRGRKTEGGK